MKVAFVADTTAEGTSGVGDYARMLSAELGSLGVEGRVFGLKEDGREGLAEAVEAFGADWVSVQFVPYAFQRKGVVSAETLPWARLRGRVGTHVMFHEIWIGAASDAPWRHKLMGWLQRRGIGAAMRALSPTVVQTSNRLYAAALKDAGMAAKVLPLFGNVPVREAAMDPYVSLLHGQGDGWGREKVWVFAFFGTIHPTFRPEQVFPMLLEMAANAGRRLAVVSIGRCAGAEEEVSKWSEQWSEARFFSIGERPAEELSGWLGAADFGLTTTPYNIVGKSGTAQAFAEHGVPVLCTEAGEALAGREVGAREFAPRFWRLSDFFASGVRKEELGLVRESGAAKVAREFLQELGG